MKSPIHLQDFITINKTVYKIEELQSQGIKTLEEFELIETLNVINNMSKEFQKISKWDQYLLEIFPHYKTVFSELNKILNYSFE